MWHVDQLLLSINRIVCHNKIYKTTSTWRRNRQSCDLQRSRQSWGCWGRSSQTEEFEEDPGRWSGPPPERGWDNEISWYHDNKIWISFESQHFQELVNWVIHNLFRTLGKTAIIWNDRRNNGFQYVTDPDKSVQLGSSGIFEMCNLAEID